MNNSMMLQQLDEFEWEIPRSFRQEMKVPVRIFASKNILGEVQRDRSLEQAVNTATLPGLAGPVVVMPDMHQGYGFPIGGVAATKVPDGVISPGGIGYDINCGVRLLGSKIRLEEVLNDLEDLAFNIDRFCPSGVGKKGKIRLTKKQLNEVCLDGSSWARRSSFASRMDVYRTEENGRINGADPEKVSAKAFERGLPQLGTLGAGNHFIEVDVIDEVFDKNAAGVLGLEEGQLVVQIHCGSRGFGHQICSDYVYRLQSAVSRYKIHLPDRELVCAPINSPEGSDYLAAMRCAANYAFANRQVLAHLARNAFEETLGGRVSDWQLFQIYDIAHNIGKFEQHEINGRQVEVCVHRKGATRAFGPGSKEIPDEYRRIGQPVLVPGSMGTSSWVLVGTEQSMLRTYGSCCHGAGRVMSRKKAKKTVRGDQLKSQLGKRGIHIRAGSLRGLAEEAPQAYKNVDEVVETVTGAGIARKVAKLRPVVVVKG
jgi:tRNA-splicing ligase RtcB